MNQFSVSNIIRKINSGDNLYYTLNDAKISINDINIERAKVFLRKGYLTNNRVNVVLDDTGEMKYAKGDLFSHLYIGNIGKIDEACNMVSISFVNDEIIEPFDSKFYIASNKFEDGEEDKNFKTKIELSRELVSETEKILKSENKELGVISGDCYYGSSENLNKWNKDGYEYFLGAKENRNLKNVVEYLGRDYRKLGSLVTATKSFQNPYIKDHFEVYTLEVELKDVDHKLKLFAITTREKERLYVTNNLELSKKDALKLHLQRSKIDVKEYKELKTELHLLDCRFGSSEGYIRHVRFVYLCFDVLRNLANKILGTLSFGLKLFIHQLCSS